MNNKYVIRDKTAVIIVDAPPNTGYSFLEVLIDVADLDHIKAWPGTWFGFVHPRNGLLYIRASKVRTHVEGYTQAQPLLHRVIADPSPGENTVHKSGNTLDCRRENLVNVRRGTAWIPPQPVDPLSVPLVRGVHYRPEKNRFECAAFHKGKKHYLGIFPVEDWEKANSLVTAFRQLGPEQFYEKYPKRTV